MYSFGAKNRLLTCNLELSRKEEIILNSKEVEIELKEVSKIFKKEKHKKEKIEELKKIENIYFKSIEELFDYLRTILNYSDYIKSSDDSDPPNEYKNSVDIIVELIENFYKISTESSNKDSLERLFKLLHKFVSVSHIG